MQSIPLAAVPSQSFSITLDGDFYDIVIRLCGATTRTPPYVDGTVIAMDITRNQVPLLLGARCVPGTPVLLYPYLVTGNFVWLTENGDLLDYTQFGISQFLIYASADELAAINAGT